MKNIIIHIPHDGHQFPEELKEFCIISDEELQHYDYEMSDINLNHIVETLPFTKISFPISRLFCDVERFLIEEPMEKYGMGFCYSKTYDGKIFKIVNQYCINKTRRYYDTHHKKLDNLLKDTNEATILIDLHSFNLKATRMELLTSKNIPDICIGYDPEFCTFETLNKVLMTAQKHRYSVAINYPYSGSIVPNKVLKNGNKYNFQSIMLEINRDCYIGQDNITIPKEHWHLYWTIKEICEILHAT